MVAAVAVAGGCRSAGDWRDVADEKAARVLGAVQRDVTGREEPVQIETPASWAICRMVVIGPSG